nr:uncharacterized protein LOC117281877 [Nicotiana tomentosiformis]
MLREFVSRFTIERIDLSSVANDWAVQPFTCGLNIRSSVASQQLKQNMIEYPAITWANVNNRSIGPKEAPRLSECNFNIDAAAIVSAIGRIKDTKWPRPLQYDLAQRDPNQSITGATPFSLVYGVESLIPVKVGEPSIRFRYATKELNDEAMNTTLELLDESREASLVRLAAQKQQIERYYNLRANLRYFNIGDLVLRKYILSTQNPNEGKLGSNWEGLYQITKITGKGSYKLGIMYGEKLPNNWNITHLKRYYY